MREINRPHHYCMNTDITLTINTYIASHFCHYFNGQYNPVLHIRKSKINIYMKSSINSKYNKPQPLPDILYYIISDVISSVLQYIG